MKTLTSETSFQARVALIASVWEKLQLLQWSYIAVLKRTGTHSHGNSRKDQYSRSMKNIYNKSEQERPKFVYI